MPRNVYSEINLHIVWHVKNSEPVLIITSTNGLRTERFWGGGKATEF